MSYARNTIKIIKGTLTLYYFSADKRMAGYNKT
jgi:hypothetical protein